MSTIVEQAIERLRQMPEDRQESLARLVLQEIEEDERWMKSTAASEDKLEQLVEQVLDSDSRGECEPLDPDRL